MSAVQIPEQDKARRARPQQQQPDPPHPPEEEDQDTRRLEAAGAAGAAAADANATTETNLLTRTTGERLKSASSRPQQTAEALVFSSKLGFFSTFVLLILNQFWEMIIPGGKLLALIWRT